MTPTGLLSQPVHATRGGLFAHDLTAQLADSHPYAFALVAGRGHELVQGAAGFQGLGQRGFGSARRRGGSTRSVSNRSAFGYQGPRAAGRGHLRQQSTRQGLLRGVEVQVETYQVDSKSGHGDYMTKTGGGVKSRATQPTHVLSSKEPFTYTSKGGEPVAAVQAADGTWVVYVTKGDRGKLTGAVGITVSCAKWVAS